MLPLPRVSLLLLCVAAVAPLVTEPALAMGEAVQGFGASSQGGGEGRVIMVTRLDDELKRPPKGSLRWALRQKGPRIVKFAVGGTITLKDRIEVKESSLTLDGTDAPDGGITIRGGSLEFNEVEDIILRQLRVRLGDETVLRKNKTEDRKRPKSSNGLDCITLKDCDRVLVDHCSLSWSCDEIIGITRCRNVTVQWCILSEPLANPAIHPYGDNHAFGINASASTLSIHHCLFGRFVMRGPQFECNDMRPMDDYTVQMEAVNNVIFDYQRSGSRYSTGVEKGTGTDEGKKFEFQFLNNLYVSRKAGPQPIEAFTRHGFAPGMKAGVQGNKVIEGNPQKMIAGIKLPAFSIKGPVLAWRSDLDSKPEPTLTERLSPREEGTAIPDSPKEKKVPLPENAVARRLFAAPVPVRPESVEIAWRSVLNAAGAGPERDTVDERIVRDAEAMTFRKPLRSQSQVGGWP